MALLRTRGCTPAVRAPGRALAGYRVRTQVAASAPSGLLALWVASIGAAASASAASPGGTLPNRAFAAEQHLQRISPDLGAEHHNQPMIVNGYLVLAGNASHQLWDISDPTAPVRLSSFAGPHGAKEAESHSVTARKTADGRHQLATISGKGVDLWDLTDPAAPVLLAAVELEGISYGDNTEAVWGLFWQGDVLYVGGTNTGLHLVDTADAAKPVVLKRLPTSALGGVSAGPLYAIGNLLVITTPKKGAGIATLDIGDPLNPALLDAVHPEKTSYIGGMYGRYAHLVFPFRTYDVTTDPSNITLVASAETVETEYMSFGDGVLFLGALRPNQGIYKVPLGDDLSVLDLSVKIEGRRPDPLLEWFTDDQFSTPVGNLLVISDDEVDIGSTIAVHDPAPDTIPPAVVVVNPPDGALGAPLTTRVGLSLSDTVDLRTVDATTLVVRPVSGGEALTGSYGQVATFVSFWPSAALEPGTTYEIVVPVGGMRDLAGNPIAVEHRSTFSTGTTLNTLACAIEPPAPARVGEPAELRAADAGADVAYSWEFGDGQASVAAADREVTHVYTKTGRYPATLTVEDSSGLRRRCGATLIIHEAPSAIAPARAAKIAAGPAGVAVVTPDADVLAWLPSGASAATFIDVPDHPVSVALAGEDAWVACRDADRVVRVGLQSGELEAELRAPWGSRPSGVLVTADGARVVVLLEAGDAVAMADAAAATWIGDPIRVRNEEPRALLGGLALLDGDTALVARFGAAADHGELFQVSLASGEVKRLVLAASPGPDRANGGRGIPTALRSPAVSPDGKRAWVPAIFANTGRGPVRDGQPLNTTNTVRTGLVFAALDPLVDVPVARLDLDDHSMAAAVATSPLGDLLFVASMGSNTVDVIDSASGELVAGARVGQAPDEVLVTPEGDLYVSESLDRRLARYDVRGLLAGLDTAARRVSAPNTVPEEPLAPEVLLGKVLFHDASDRRLSQDGYIACAACHPDGAEDGRVWDFTDRGEGLRNTIDLRGRRGAGHGPVHWTANFDEIHDFEHDIRSRFGGAGLMEDEDFDAHAEPLGAPKAGLSAPLDALAAYVTSLGSYPRSPYRAADGSRTPEAERGEQLFRALDCLDCHSGEDLTDSASRERHDVGTTRETSGQRRGGPLDGFDTPTLRGVWATAPYLHDGSAETLRDALLVVGHGNAGLLVEADMEALLAFLLQLEDEAVSLQRLPPYEPPPLPEPSPAPPDAGRPSAESGESGCTSGSGPWSPASLVLLVLLGLLRRRREAR